MTDHEPQTNGVTPQAGTYRHCVALWRSGVYNPDNYSDFHRIKNLNDNLNDETLSSDDCHHAGRGEERVCRPIRNVSVGLLCPQVLTPHLNYLWSSHRKLFLTERESCSLAPVLINIGVDSGLITWEDPRYLVLSVECCSTLGGGQREKAVMWQDSSNWNTEQLLKLRTILPVTLPGQ